MRHTISVLVENEAGVLARISGMFSARGYNIESLSVGETEDPEISRMTTIVRGDDRVIEQVVKQLNKQICVIKINDLTSEEHVERELVLIKVNAASAQRSEIIEIVTLFRAKIVDVASKSLTVEATGDEGKIGALIDLLKRFGIREMARTGKVALTRGQ